MIPPLSPEETSPSVGIQQFLGLSLTPDIQAMLPTQQLVEILNLHPRQITPIPGVSPQVMGVCNWRGEVLWLIDLGQVLGKLPLYQQGYRQSHYNIVVVKTQNDVIGLVIDQITQVHTCDLQSLLKPVSQNNPSFPPCVQAYWLSPQEEAFWVLDCEALVEFFQTDH